MKYVRMGIVITVAALTLTTAGHDRVMAAQLYGGVAALKIPNTTITLAETVAAGDFVPSAPLPPAGPVGGLVLGSSKDLPEFCRVAAVSKPTQNPRSSSRFGCLRIGMASSSASAMEAWVDRSAIR